MLVDGIAKAQARTRLDMAGAQIWSLDRLCVAHLPYTVKQMRREPTQYLDVPLEGNTQFSLNALNPNPLLTVQRAPPAFTDEHFSEDGVYIEDMPIKEPDGRIILPHNIYWGTLNGFLSEMLDFEMKYNPVLRKQYLYLTIQQGWVKAGTVQRVPGLHLDGFQKASIRPQVAQHQLAISNVLPTEFVGMRYDRSGLPDTKKELFAALTKQSEGHVRYKPLPYELHMLNAFCPHAPGVAVQDCYRTFIRLSASVIPFMREGNTRNPFIPVDWNEDAKRSFYNSIAA